MGEYMNEKEDLIIVEMTASELVDYHDLPKDGAVLDYLEAENAFIDKYGMKFIRGFMRSAYLALDMSEEEFNSESDRDLVQGFTETYLDKVADLCKYLSNGEQVSNAQLEFAIEVLQTIRDRRGD